MTGLLYLPVCCVLIASFACGNKHNIDKRSWKTGSKIVISDHDLNMAVKFAQEAVAKFERLEQSLDSSDIEVEECTPSHGQLIESYPDEEALVFGRAALVANKATNYLIHQHCLKYKLSRDDCSQISNTWTMKSTPLKEKCAAQFRNIKCSTSYKYRSFDGTCNHINVPSLGMTYAPYKRLLFPKYADGVMQPRRSVTKKPLPSARFISNIMIPDSDIPDSRATLALAQWTQFIANDMAHTAVTKMVHTGSSIECCRASGGSLSPRYIHPSCDQIRIPPEDPDYSPYYATCMNYVRSVTSVNPGCTFGPANQMNQATHYLDGSMVYGSTAAKALSLRTLQGGRLAMKSSKDTEFLSYATTPGEQCQISGDVTICYKSGDTRVNNNPHQTAMYTLWAREHNRLADQLAVLNPKWSDETLYQEARRIVIAEIQHITYEHWVPAVLGGRLENIGFREGEDPTVSNSFATAAIRFVNSMLQSQLMLYNEERLLNETLILKDHFYNPGVLETDGAMDKLLLGLATQNSQRADSSFVEDVTSQLFRGSNPVGLDIVSLDIQRGRDHGLPSYNQYRQLCGLQTSDKFDSFLDTISAPMVQKLKSVYSHPDDVDLLVGGMAEHPATNSMLGRTFSCLVADQMKRTRRADRFYYDVQGQPGSLTHSQIQEIRKASLARIICDNSENIQTMQPDVFKVPDHLNKIVRCSDNAIPAMDLTKWSSS